MATANKLPAITAILKRLAACSDAVAWAANYSSAQDAWVQCERGDWMLWLCARLGIERKLVVRADCACARPSLAHLPVGEDCPRIAIEMAEQWCDGRATIEDVRRAAHAAYAAYADADAAEAAAHAAYAAAYAAYSVDAADAAADAADADADAAYAAYAAVNAAADAADAAADAADAYSAARARSLADSAIIVRRIIPWELVTAKIAMLGL